MDAEKVYTVGVALKKEKARKHIRDELLSCAERNGIKIVVIDEFRPLEEQGPFDAILQKIRRPGRCCVECIQPGPYGPVGVRIDGQLDWYLIASLLFLMMQNLNSNWKSMLQNTPTSNCAIHRKQPCC
jgi:hypothetical protein